MKFYPPLRDLHPSHTITRDGVDDMTTWHRCAVCGATDAAGDGRLAEPCVRPLAPGDVATLKSGGPAMTVCVVEEWRGRPLINVMWGNDLELKCAAFDPRALTLVQPGAAHG
jgi:uncharacterized protein YodC (DUF2158 family)